MLYIVTVKEDGEVFQYEHGNLRHALEHYDMEETATVSEYDHGEEKILLQKECGVEIMESTTEKAAPKETMRLYMFTDNKPIELQNIMQTWYNLSLKEGDKGSCVLGAGFRFEWNDNSYFMHACSPWQGSLSWETHTDTIKQMLIDIGATDIYYDWGRMD